MIWLAPSGRTPSGVNGLIDGLEGFASGVGAAGAGAMLAGIIGIVGQIITVHGIICGIWTGVIIPAEPQFPHIGHDPQTVIGVPAAAVIPIGVIDVAPGIAGIQIIIRDMPDIIGT